MTAEKLSPKSLHLTELRASNFMGLKAVSVVLDGAAGVVEVTGPNGSGKTSFMRAVECLVGGDGVRPTEAIRRGEEEAELIGKLKGSYGEIIVERRFSKTPKGEVSTVVVRGADGSRYDKPQTVLNALFNATLDPEAFESMAREKKAELLRELAGLNLGALEGRITDVFEKRAGVNKKGADLKARFTAMPTPPAELPEKPVDVDALLRDQNRLQSIRLENQQKRNALAAATQLEKTAELQVRAAVDRISQIREEYEAKLAAAEKAEGAVHANFDALVKKGDELRQATGELVDPEVGDLTAKISAAQATNLWVERRDQRMKVELELAGLQKESDELGVQLEALRKERLEKIASAKFPVEGLGLGTDGFATFNGLPFEQANHAQRLRASTAIMLARNPTMRVLGIRNGSALDSNGMRVIAEEAAKRDAQILVERVADKGEVGIIFEDGEVVSKPRGKLKAVPTGEEGGAA